MSRPDLNIYIPKYLNMLICDTCTGYTVYIGCCVIEEIALGA